MMIIMKKVCPLSTGNEGQNNDEDEDDEVEVVPPLHKDQHYCHYCQRE